MKKWLEYQLKHQVVNYNWASCTTPIANLNNKLATLFPIIKQKCENRTYISTCRNYFTDDGYLSRAGGLELTREQLEEYIKDPQYSTIMDRNGIEVYAPKDEFEAITKVFKELLGDSISISMIRVHVQKPGQMLSLHIDRVHHIDFTGEQNHLSAEPSSGRYILFFDDWAWGQTFQLGTEFLKWKAGDLYTWNSRDVPHGTCNFGYDDRYMMVVNVNKTA